MMASGSQVVHQMAKGISQRIVDGAEARAREEPAEEPVEREGSRAEGGGYRPMLKPCILAVGDVERLWGLRIGCLGSLPGGGVELRILFKLTLRQNRDNHA